MNTNKSLVIPLKEVDDLYTYSRHYSEKDFWSKIKKVARQVGGVVLTPMVQLYYVLQAGEVSIKHKAYILGALGYFILPIDFIPECIFPVIGFTDDIAVATLVLKLVKENLTPEILAKADNKVWELLRR